MQITKENTVAEVVSKNLGSDHVFSKYKIDFCCGGGDTLEKVCKERGVKFEVLKQEIEIINSKISGSLNIDELDIPTLIKQAKDKYHTVISDSFYEISPYAAKVANVHGTVHKELVEINELYKSIELIINEAFRDSILGLYPVINEIVETSEKSKEISIATIEAFKKGIERNEIAQKFIGNSFKQISNLSSNYLIPADACNSYTYLYKNLKNLEHKVHKYMHFEKYILIPKALNIIA